MATDIDRQAAGSSPANLLKHIAGAVFPATKGDLLSIAKEKGAPDEVIQSIEQLPSDTFGGQQDILKHYSDMNL